MAGQIKHTTTIEVTTNNGASISYEIPHTVSAVTETGTREIDIAASSTNIIWDSTSTAETITAFDYLFLSNTGANSLQIEFVVDKDGSVGEELHTVTLPKGASYVLFSKSAFANHSAADAFAGTLDFVEKIRVKEPNAVAGSLLFIIAD